MAKRIIWSEQERLCVINTLVSFLRANDKPPELLTQPGWFPYFFKEAQKFLPADRQRVLHVADQCEWLVDGVHTAFGTKRAPAPAPKLSVEEFLQANIEAVLELLGKTYVVALRSDLVSRPIHRVQSTKPKQLRVLIVGTKPSQAADLSAAFGHLLDLRFWYSTDGNKSSLPHADYAVMLANFNSHSTQDKLKAMFKARFQVSYGVVTSLHKILNELVVYGTPAVQVKTSAKA